MRVLHVGRGLTPYHHGGLIAYVEDLLRAQAERGDEVSYFFCGRHYPLIATRLRRFRRDGVRMYEVLNSPVIIGPEDRGSRWPDREVTEPAVERMFREVLDDVRPEVVHVHDIGGLPSSLLTIAPERGLPVVMTLQDYFPLCPTVKLFDVDGNLCLRTDPAPICVRCTRDAPGELEVVVNTLGHHRRRAEARLPALRRLPKPRALARRRQQRRPPTPDAADPARVEQIPDLQRRRDVNVARLNRVDRLLAMSSRVAEIYATLGVDPARLHTMHLTLSRLDSLRPRRLDGLDPPVRFVTLGGCASAAKGSHVVAEALEELSAMGLTAEELTLTIAGHVDPTVAARLEASPLARLVGGYASAELGSVLEGFHVGVVPSIWEEAYGYVGVELLAKGLPLVANAIGGIVEYAREGETAWLNHDRSAGGLAAIMARIARDPGEVVALNHRVVKLRPQLVKPMSEHLDELAGVYAELVPQSSRTAVSSG